MDIVIRTGFERISHAIDFQPATEPKGKQLVLANHVCNVEEHRKNGLSDYIQAAVIRQTSVTSVPYTTRLNVSSIYIFQI